MDTYAPNRHMERKKENRLMSDVIRTMLYEYWKLKGRSQITIVIICGLIFDTN